MVDPKHRPFPTFQNALEYAAERDDVNTVHTLLTSANQIKQNHLEIYKESFFEMLESIHDFELEMKFECKSSLIPFFENFAPSDTFKFHKSGSNVRLDLSLLGYKNMKSVRGEASIIFKGRGTQNEGELVVVNHTSQKVTSIFMDVDEAKVQATINKAIKRRNTVKESTPEFTTIKPSINWLGNKVYDEIEGISVQKYNVKCAYKVQETRFHAISKTKLNKERQYIDKNKFMSYKDYLDFLSENNM